MSFKISASHKFATQNTPVEKSKGADKSLSTEDYMLYNLDSSSSSAKQGKAAFKPMAGNCIRQNSSAQPDFY